MSCPHCQGTRWRRRDVDGIERVERCTCWREKISHDALRDAHIPARYRTCDFSSFVAYDNHELLHAVDRIRAFASRFPVVDKGLLLVGPPGIGKTHLAVSALREVVLERGAQGVYFDTRTLLSTIRSTYNPVTRTSEADLLARVMGADLLVLDDLGAERPTDWVEETMNLIVNTRYNDRKPTIFTSNYETVADADDRDVFLLQERVGFRIYSRLREMCEFLIFSGPDYREFEYPPTAANLLEAWHAQKRGPRRKLPRRTASRARAHLREREGQLDLGWFGGKAGS